MTDQLDPIAASDEEISQYLSDTGCVVTPYVWGRGYKWGAWEYGVSSEWSPAEADRDAVNARISHTARSES